jgi:arylsulfatase A-like enzyme
MAGLSASPSSAVRDGDWKLIHFYETDGVELYNLRDDPGETRNLSARHPKLAVRLRRQLDAWRKSVGAQPPVPKLP